MRVQESANPQGYKNGKLATVVTKLIQTINYSTMDTANADQLFRTVCMGNKSDLGKKLYDAFKDACLSTDTRPIRARKTAMAVFLRAS